MCKPKLVLMKYKNKKELNEYIQYVWDTYGDIAVASTAQSLEDQYERNGDSLQYLIAFNSNKIESYNIVESLHRTALSSPKAILVYLYKSDPGNLEKLKQLEAFCVKMVSAVEVNSADSKSN